VKGEAGVEKRLESGLLFVSSELNSDRPASKVIASRFAEILFVQALRDHLEQAKEEGAESMWPLTDPQIGKALNLFHEMPYKRWTVGSIAEEVAMCRSSFACRFTQLVGEAPLTYLTRWRMHQAARILRTSTIKIDEVAGRVGYDAEAAFKRAFKRWIGFAPGAYRSQVTQEIVRHDSTDQPCGISRIAGGTGNFLETLKQIVLVVERLASPALCSILLVDPDGQHLRHGAAPSLPGEYNRAVDGIRIGPRAGSCGTAVYRHQPVIVPDIAVDPIWRNFRSLASRFDLKSCWSQPIMADDKRVLATFAVYYHERHEPQRTEKKLIADMAGVVRIALLQHKGMIGAW
jgi:AraC-like DNA-binding protein